MHMARDDFEVELKLQTDDEALLDRLWSLERLGSFDVVARHRQRHHNVYFDSPDHALDRARGNLRWRTVAGSGQAELTYKGPAEVHNGVFRRQEVTVVLPSAVDPLAINPPQQPLAIALAITANLAPTELILETDRRGLQLVSAHARVELDIDITTMPTTAYRDLEIEAELAEGDPDVLTELEAVIGQLGPVRRAQKGKRARGWAYLKRA